jgi:IS5 family transposase
MQYFLGLEAFTYEYEQVMTPSLLVSIRKRIDLDVFESLTDDLIRKGLKLKSGVQDKEVDGDSKDNDDDPDPHPGTRVSFKWTQRSVMRTSSIPQTWIC